MPYGKWLHPSPSPYEKESVYAINVEFKPLGSLLRPLAGAIYRQIVPSEFVYCVGFLSFFQTNKMNVVSMEKLEEKNSVVVHCASAVQPLGVYTYTRDQPLR